MYVCVSARPSGGGARPLPHGGRGVLVHGGWRFRPGSGPIGPCEESLQKKLAPKTLVDFLSTFMKAHMVFQRTLHHFRHVRLYFLFGHFLAILGHIWIKMELFWSQKGHFRVILDRFRAISDSFLGPLWDHSGDVFCVALTTYCGRLMPFFCPFLGHFRPFCSRFGVFLRSFCGCCGALGG